MPFSELITDVSHYTNSNQKNSVRMDFFNGIILNESYVIGANRNEYLNIFSLIIFGFVDPDNMRSYIFQIKKKIELKSNYVFISCLGQVMACF